jgi:uncharacterized protein
MIPERYFIDTSYIYALLNKKDKFHFTARTLSTALHRLDQFIVSDMVLMEACSLLAKTKARRSITAFINEITINKHYTILHTDADVFHQAFRLYESYDDKEWSLVDCVSFLVMKKERLRFALTADNHFEQFGYIAVLRHPELFV